MWGDFPEKLSAATGMGVFAWSRVGYGQSSPAKLPRTLDFMHVEAREVLPRLLDAIGFRHGLLVGHSDGASIAAIYGGTVQDHRLRGLVLMAPHFIVEDVTINSIREIRQAFDTTDVRQRFQRWHADADATVRGWTDVWMKNDFHTWDISEELAYIRVPILIIQGEHDHYGTARQIEIAREECYCPVDVLLIPGIQHIPHREAPEVTLKAIAEFAIACCTSTTSPPPLADPATIIPRSAEARVRRSRREFASGFQIAAAALRNDVRAGRSRTCGCMHYRT